MDTTIEGNLFLPNACCIECIYLKLGTKNVKLYWSVTVYCCIQSYHVRIGTDFQSMQFRLARLALYSNERTILRIPLRNSLSLSLSHTASIHQLILY
jgi:hypothetical protein